MGLDWKKIWDRKGSESTDDLRILNAYERVPKGLELEIICTIKERLKIKPSDRVLDLGCGAGLFGKHIGECDYIGVDYSLPQIKKLLSLVGRPALVCQANNLPFKDNYFDKIICYGVFFYFNNKRYANEVMEEMQRVCKPEGLIYIWDLPIRDERESHLLFTPDEFDGGKIYEGFWTKDRFDVLIDSTCIKVEKNE